MAHLYRVGGVIGHDITAQARGYVPKNGFIPDEKTAIAVGQAILIPIYGEKQIASERPFRASLDSKDIWTVSGSLPKGWDGGVAVIKLRRQDGRILYVSHGK